MATVLVVYGSWTGSTAGVAQRLGRALNERGATVKVMPASSAPDPSGYDAVVVGSAIRAGQWHPAAKEWLADNAPQLTRKPTAFYSVCLTPVVHPLKVSQARGYMLPLIAETGVRPVGFGVFPGVYDPSVLSLPDRARAGLWGARAGDFRDLPAVDTWAGQMARRLWA